MNMRAVSNRSVWLGKGRSVVILPILGLVLLGLVGLAVISLSQTPAAVESVAQPLTGERFLAANPELKATGSSARSESAFLAQNPELSAVWRYAAQEEGAGTVRGAWYYTVPRH